MQAFRPASGQSVDDLGQAVFAGKKCKEEEVHQSPSNKFMGLRMGRDFWQMFIDQETSLGNFCKSGIIHRKSAARSLSSLLLRLHA